MKKSILIGVLAAMMLVAFVACDNSSASSAFEDNIITGLSVTSDVPTYFKGETVDTSTISVSAQTIAGTAKPVAASDLKFTLDTDVSTTSDTTDEPVTIGTVEYVGFNYTGASVPAVEIKAYVYTMDAIEIEGPSTPYYQGYVPAEFDYEPYTVTGVANDADGNELYSRELVAETEYTAELEATDVENVGGSSITFTANADFGTVTDEYDIIVQQDRVTGLTLATVDDYEVIEGSVAPGTTQYGDLLKVTQTYVSGKTENVTGAVINYTGLAADNKFPVYGATVTATATYNGRTSNGVSIDISRNYVTAFTAEYKTSTATAVVKPGDPLVSDYIVVTATKWADDTATKPTTALAYTVSDSGIMPDTVATNGSWAFSVTLNDYPQAGTQVMVVKAGSTTTAAPQN